MTLSGALRALAAAGALSPALAAAEMYPDRVLRAEAPRLAARVEQIRSEGFEPVLSGEERRALRGLRLDFAPLGPGGSPFGFAADARNRVVYMPLAGLKFIEDLTLAYAWRHLAGRSLEPVDEYLAMLRWRPEKDWPGGRWMDPLEALGVPDRIWEKDKEVDGLSLRFRNTAWAFILAHEFGHVAFCHRCDGSPASVANEEAADAFAFDLLNRTDTIPMGAILYFQAMAAFTPNRADFPSDDAYERWLRDEATHPVSGARLSAIARRMEDAARESFSRDRADVLRFIAVRLAEIGSILSDPAMQQLITRRAVHGDPADLRRR